MDAQYAREVGIDLDEEIDDLDEVQINAWVCGDKLLRAVINPFTPYRLPYHAFPYERNPYNFFGVGVAENMNDSQQIMNGHARMAIDNLAMSGSLVFDVDESALSRLDKTWTFIQAKYSEDKLECLVKQYMD